MNFSVYESTELNDNPKEENLKKIHSDVQNDQTLTETESTWNQFINIELYDSTGNTSELEYNSKTLPEDKSCLIVTLSRSIRW